MKGSIISNYGHGAWLSGDRLLVRQELFRQWLGKQDHEFLIDLSGEVLRDRGEGHLEGEVVYDVDDFMQMPSIRRRNQFETCPDFSCSHEPGFQLECELLIPPLIQCAPLILTTSAFFGWHFGCVSS